LHPAPTGPDAILAAIDALSRPEFDRNRSQDKTYVASFEKTMAAIWKRQDELEREFCERYPNHPQAESILFRRWSNALTTRQEDADQVQREVDQYLKEHPNGPASEDARTQFANLRVRLANDDPDKLTALAEAFAKNDRHNEAGADYFLAAARAAHDGEKRDAILRQIILNYPNSPGAIRAGGILRRASQIGMPFELGFFDIRSGEWVHTRQLRGKVIVVDFWATWCAPCVGEIPHLQKVYAQYKDQGLEILSVSLDGPRTETSVETVKDFVAKQRIPWPQYYQGEGFDSTFSASWGVNSIPAVFVIDQAGRLYSTDAGREKLDEILVKLLQAPK
jgi:thiol-disulfide isomerase/thioredoxin